MKHTLIIPLAAALAIAALSKASAAPSTAEWARESAVIACQEAADQKHCVMPVMACFIDALHRAELDGISEHYYVDACWAMDVTEAAPFVPKEPQICGPKHPGYPPCATHSSQ